MNLPGKYDLNTWYKYRVTVDKGNVYLEPNVGSGAEPIFISNYDFTATEDEGQGAGAYFKAGIYTQKGCVGVEDPENDCNVAGGMNDLTIVEFKDFARESHPEGKK